MVKYKTILNETPFIQKEDKLVIGIFEIKRKLLLKNGKIIHFTDEQI